MKVALAQISPVFLDRESTLKKIVRIIEENADAALIAFGEALVPGYPFWVERTGGAEFAASIQEKWHAAYQREAVAIEQGDLALVCEAARDTRTCVYVGVMERPGDRGGHSLYASLVFVDNDGAIKSVHRKLMPTYEERLVWATGDGHGLRTHAVGAFTVGGLNCWENWMPLARASLYAQGGGGGNLGQRWQLHCGTRRQLARGTNHRRGNGYHRRTRQRCHSRCAPQLRSKRPLR